MERLESVIPLVDLMDITDLNKIFDKYQVSLDDRKKIITIICRMKDRENKGEEVA